jgi:hypothetical protein
VGGSFCFASHCEWRSRFVLLFAEIPFCGFYGFRGWRSGGDIHFRFSPVDMALTLARVEGANAAGFFEPNGFPVGNISPSPSSSGAQRGKTPAGSSKAKETSLKTTSLNSLKSSHLVPIPSHSLAKDW